MYILSDGDLEIFSLAAENANALTDYYFRNPGKETGWLFDDWQLALHHASQSDITVIGGFGSGKTAGIAMSAITWATMTPYFAFYDVAPTANQSYQMFQYLKERLFEGVPFYDRFIAQGGKVNEKPNPLIVIKYGLRLPNGRVQQCTSRLMFLSSDKNATKIKNISCDWICLDQAEEQPDLEEAIRNLGTRTRGERPDGRPRLGRLTLLANSNDNPVLWNYYDLQEIDPETYLSLTVSTYVNKHLTDSQVKRMEGRASITGNKDEIEQHLKGARPIGRGKYFPGKVILGCSNAGLDAIMTQAELENQVGFHTERFHGAGIVSWVMPPEPGRIYLQMGDPGSGIPPYRDAPVIGVFDITEFPERPAVMRAFWWGNGGGQISPFIGQFKLWMTLFGTTFRCGWDATGLQKHLNELAGHVDEEMDMVLGIDFTGLKPLMLRALQLFCEKALFQWPNDIKAIKYQLGRYDIPDDKLPQDIVAMLMMVAWWLAETYGWKHEAYDKLIRSLPDESGIIQERGGRPLSTREASHRPGR